MKARRGTLVVVGVLALAGSRACASPSPEPEHVGAGPGTGGGAASSTAAWSSGPSISSGPVSVGAGGAGGALNGGPCDPMPLPDGFPSGWAHYEDWACKCAFYVPSTPAALPAPPTWEPCGAVAGTVDCQAMKIDWTGATPAFAVSFLERDAQGKPLLAFRRLHLDAPVAHAVDLITAPDGPVRMSMMQLFLTPNPVLDPGCVANLESLGEGRYVLNARGHNAYGSGSSPEHRGALGGSVDDAKPTVLAHYVDGVERTYIAGSKWLGERHLDTTLLATPWDLTQAVFVTSAAVDPDGLASVQFLSRGDALFYSTSVLVIDGINVWDPVRGARPFIRWVGDYTKGAADLGTDGTDMVWTYGEGKAPGDSAYPVRSVMTAPYTADPAAVIAKRLRSSPFVGVGNYTWVVGCGYAANAAAANDVLACGSRTACRGSCRPRRTSTSRPRCGRGQSIDRPTSHGGAARRGLRRTVPDPAAELLRGGIFVRSAASTEKDGDPSGN